MIVLLAVEDTDAQGNFYRAEKMVYPTELHMSVLSKDELISHELARLESAVRRQIDARNLELSKEPK